MIIRFGRCALCNTLCWVTLLHVLKEGLTGGHERDKGEGRERVNSPERESAVSSPLRPRVISERLGCYSLNVSFSSSSPSHLIY